MAAHEERQVLTPNLGSGPHGLGHPDDHSLRKVESEVLIPKLMRERAKTEKCTQVVKEFEECCKSANVLMVVKCRKENTSLKKCLTEWFTNDDFRNECRDIYLKQRSEYRRTGISKKQKELNLKSNLPQQN